MAVRIKKANGVFEREPLIRPFGFKGGYMSEIWQISVLLEADNSVYGLGLGNQNVLWSDPRVFASTSSAGGNCMMFAVTDRAMQMAKQTSFRTPIDLQEQIFDELYHYAQVITGIKDLHKTFVLNALVPLDNAAWVLYARKNGISDFDGMIPETYRNALAHRHEKVASVPLASYALGLEEVRKLVEHDGYFILKIKLGAPGSEKEMLEQDMARLEGIHKTIGDTRVSWTRNGKIPYYFDANGRYQQKETLQVLLDHAKQMGAFEQIMVVEEPFPEKYRVNVDDLGVLVVADESAHDAENVKERIEMGYGAIALKPAAKTLSMTLKMARVAHEKNTPCFCADLTVNPILVEWNKNVAARLAPLPGLDIGLLETNGHQNYKRWKQMLACHPLKEASWVTSSEGVFFLDRTFYETSGGIFKDVQHYMELHETS